MSTQLHCIGPRRARIPRIPRPSVPPVKRRWKVLLLALAALVLALGLASTSAGSKECEANSVAEVPRCWVQSVNNADLGLVNGMLAPDFTAKEILGPEQSKDQSRDVFVKAIGALIDPKLNVRFEVGFSDSMVVIERSLTKWRVDSIYLLSYVQRAADGKEGATIKLRTPVSLFVQRASEPTPHYEIYRWESYAKGSRPAL